MDTLQGDPVSKTPEQQLEEYEMMVEQIKDALYMLDSEGRYLLVNGAYEDLTGCSRDELIGSTMSIVLDSDAMAERRELTLELLKRGSERRGHAWQSTLHTADKTQLPVEVNFATLEYNGEFIGIVGSARDISDRRRREQELSVLSRVLRHNLGNKVNIIQGYAEVIGDHIADENALDYTERIRRTAGKLIQQSGKARDITIAVDDDGPGIPEHKISVVSSEEETPLTHSEGIGLWMVTRTVNAANGEMSFEESDLGGTGSNWRSRRRSRRH